MRELFFAAIAVLLVTGSASALDDVKGKLPGRPGPGAFVTLRVTVADFDTGEAIERARVRCRSDKSGEARRTDAGGFVEIFVFIRDNNPVQRAPVICSASKVGYFDAVIDAGYIPDNETRGISVRLRRRDP